MDANLNSSVLRSFFKKFGFALVSTGTLAVISLVASFSATDRVVKSTELVAHTSEVIGSAEAVIAHLTDYETGQRGFLLVGNPSYLEPYQAGKLTITNDLSTLRRLVSDNSAQVRRVDELRAVVGKRTEILDKTVELKLAGKTKEALDIVRSGDGKELHDKAREIINDIQEVERGLLQERREDTDIFVFITKCLLSINALLVLVTLAYVHIFTRQEFELRIEAENNAKAIAKQNEQLARKLEFSMAEASTEIEQLVEAGVQRNRLLEMLNPQKDGRS